MRRKFEEGTHLRNERLESRRLDKQMNMRRPHRTSIERLEDIAGWTVVRNRISRRPQALERVSTICARGELAAVIVVWLFWVLLLVESCK